ALALLAASCGGSSSGAGGSNGPCTPAQTPVVNFAAYSTPREVYGKVIPAFQAMWKEQHGGQSVIFQESYAGSTTQAQNVIAGYPADVVALSLAPDVDAIKDAGLITHDWTEAPDGGMVSTSVVVFDVRPGNPLGIRDFDDLTRPGVQILTPDPAQSGGARWNIVAAWVACARGMKRGLPISSGGSSRTSSRSTRAPATRSRASSRATATLRSRTRTRFGPRRRLASRTRRCIRRRPCSSRTRS